jgi:hypothetical protein
MLRLKRYTILPVVLYGCGFRFVTFKEEHRLMAYENRVLRRIFRLLMDEVMGGITKNIFGLI